MEGAAAASALASAVELRSRLKRHELTPLGQDSHLRAYGAHPGRVRAAAPPQGRVSSARCACARARRRRVRRIGAQGGAPGVLLIPLSLHDEGERRAAASPRVCRRDAARALAPIACASARPRAERPVPSANAPGGRGFGRDLKPLPLPQVVSLILVLGSAILCAGRRPFRLPFRAPPASPCPESFFNVRLEPGRRTRGSPHG